VIPQISQVCLDDDVEVDINLARHLSSYSYKRSTPTLSMEVLYTKAIINILYDNIQKSGINFLIDIWQIIPRFILRQTTNQATFRIHKNYRFYDLNYFNSRRNSDVQNLVLFGSTLKYYLPLDPTL